MSVHVVHVEDDKPLRGILSVALRAAEPQIKLVQFIQASEAIPYIEANKDDIDLYIFDIRLPGEIDGLHLAQYIRQINCPGYLVLTSAYVAPSRDTLTAVCGEYYPKPWHIMDLTPRLLEYRLNRSGEPSGRHPRPGQPPITCSPSDNPSRSPSH